MPIDAIMLKSLEATNVLMHETIRITNKLCAIDLISELK